MYTTSNNVTISGVSTGITTTLSAAINAESTTINLSEVTNFNATTGKYSRTAASEYHIKIGDEIIKYTTISSTGAISIITDDLMPIALRDRSRCRWVLKEHQLR